MRNIPMKSMTESERKRGSDFPVLDKGIYLAQLVGFKSGIEYSDKKGVDHVGCVYDFITLRGPNKTETCVGMKTGRFGDEDDIAFHKDVALACLGDDEAKFKKGIESFGGYGQDFIDALIAQECKVILDVDKYPSKAKKKDVNSINACYGASAEKFEELVSGSPNANGGKPAASTADPFGGTPAGDGASTKMPSVIKSDPFA